MYLNKQKKENGDLYLSIREKYHVPKKGSRERTIESLGYLSELKEKYEDPVAHFEEYARVLTLKKKAAASTQITIDTTEVMDTGQDDLKNVGYGVLKELYLGLELDKFWRSKTRGRNMQYSLDKIFRLLVFSRILYPGSKKETYENRGIYFEKFEGFSLDDVYNSLDHMAEHKESLQQWIYSRSEKICTRDMGVSYFDCTNYYFDIGCPDIDLTDEDGNPVDKDGNKTASKYRKRGPEKNHRPDPIVSMGLLMDGNGIPLAYDLFPGNESEKLHMRPVLNRVKEEFSNTRTIVVADRGLNTADNIYFINGDNKGEVNERDGYIYGQSVRGADSEFKEWVLKDGYTPEKVVNSRGETVKFVHKSRIHPKELHVNVTKPGRKKKAKKKVVIDQKQMVYYSEKYAKKQRMERAIMIQRAMDLIEHPKKYDKVTAAGSAAYVKNIAFSKDTGEIVDGRNLEIDMDKIFEEEKYDGYYAIVTSELKMSDQELRDKYRGLAEIEDTFKISKSEFDSRPVYVRTNDHIDAHFASCFAALVIIRLLQIKLERKYGVGKICESLRRYNCVEIDVNRYQFLYYDEVLEACGKMFKKEYKYKYQTRQQIQHLLRY